MFKLELKKYKGKYYYVRMVDIVTISLIEQDSKTLTLVNKSRIKAKGSLKSHIKSLDKLHFNLLALSRLHQLLDESEISYTIDLIDNKYRTVIKKRHIKISNHEND